jgi:hypothetical protein
MMTLEPAILLDAVAGSGGHAYRRPLTAEQAEVLEPAAAGAPVAGAPSQAVRVRWLARHGEPDER